MALAPVARAFFVPVSYARTYFPFKIGHVRTFYARTCCFFYLLPLTYLDNVIT